MVNSAARDHFSQRNRTLTFALWDRRSILNLEPEGLSHLTIRRVGQNLTLEKSPQCGGSPLKLLSSNETGSCSKIRNGIIQAAAGHIFLLKDLRLPHMFKVWPALAVLLIFAHSSISEIHRQLQILSIAFRIVDSDGSFNNRPCCSEPRSSIRLYIIYCQAVHTKKNASIYYTKYLHSKQCQSLKVLKTRAVFR